jgi:N-acetylglutamate synthase-like GNAT family acetyltransferase
MKYYIKSSAEVTQNEVKTIIETWSIEEWKYLTLKEFSELFKSSDFHLLYDQGLLVSALRINKEFSFDVNGELFSIPELVGFVSVIQGRGYGRHLLKKLKNTLKESNVECIGFCSSSNRAFYEKCGFEVFENQAKYFYELNDKKLVPSDDDDVVDINLDAISKEKILSLGKDKKAVLAFET